MLFSTLRVYRTSDRHPWNSPRPVEMADQGVETEEFGMVTRICAVWRTSETMYLSDGHIASSSWYPPSTYVHNVYQNNLLRQIWHQLSK